MAGAKLAGMAVATFPAGKWAYRAAVIADMEATEPVLMAGTVPGAAAAGIARARDESMTTGRAAVVTTASFLTDFWPGRGACAGVMKLFLNVDGGGASVNEVASC